jgi:hypothetical protein
MTDYNLNKSISQLSDALNRVNDEYKNISDRRMEIINGLSELKEEKRLRSKTTGEGGGRYEIQI